MLNIQRNEERNGWKFTTVTGHVFFLILLLFSILFYRERMLYADPAFFSFLMIDGNNFSIALGRWGTALSQILPLMALKNGVSLEGFLQTYSASFILIYYLVFLIINYGYRNIQGTWILMLSLCLTFRLTFYYPTAELYQGIALSVLLWVILQNELRKVNGIKSISLVLIAAFIVVISFFHQLTLFTVLFVLLVSIINHNLKDKNLLALLIFTLVWYIIRIKVLTYSTYEKEKMLSGDEFFKQLFNIRDLPSTENYKEFLKHQILIPMVAFIIGMIMLWRKQKLLAGFITAFFLGFSMLVCVTLYKGESRLMYENYYTVFGLFIAVCLIYAYPVPSRNFATVALTILLAVSLKGIYNERKILSERIENMQCMINYGRTFPERKFLISEKQMFNYNEILPFWTFPFESLMLSTLQQPADAVTFYSEKESNHFLPEQINKRNVFLGPEWSPFWFSSNAIKRQYFELPETGYISLSTSQKDTTLFKEDLFTKENFNIIPIGGTVYSSRGRIFCEVQLINKSNQILASLPEGSNPVYLSYHLCDETGKGIKWDNSRTGILLDLYPGKSMVQKIKIDLPEKPGKYRLQFDMVTEGIRWWGINTEKLLIVN